jgi:AcrR family transcriptional regulator
MPLPRTPRKRAPRIPSSEARQRIIDAANRLLRERRFRELTVEDVMTEAGLTRTVFYRHFEGLPGIIIGLLDNLLASVVAEGDTSDPTDRATMHRQLALTVDTFQEYGPLFLALEDASHYDDHVEQAYRALIERAIDILTDAIQRGITLGHTPPMPARDVAEALNAMNRAYLLGLVARDPKFDREAALEALWTVWRRTTWP